MIDKPGGVDFDRRPFAQPRVPATYSASRIAGLIFALGFLAVIAFIGYKLLPTAPTSAAPPKDVSLAEVNRRLYLIEDRLTKLEEARTLAQGTQRREISQRDEAPDPPIHASTSPSRRPTRQVYRISPTPSADAPAAAPQQSVGAPTRAGLTRLQQGFGQIQKDQQANNDAWQATTDRLADMAGEVGSQNVQILRNQDELNELVNRTELEAIPFELLRGSNPTPVGPVSLVLKSTNPKKQSYTVCVYVQPSCVELKDRMIHEVVQIVVARNSTPLEIVATRIVKDEILGYLEVPRDQLAH